ncbi:hypothetical protein HHK36_014933 [Tetracentron sinense]|uniref:Uncharacterized protein n=1 Tax=Tetracentron sinense TaxID=13715 RepID=A0A834ZA64_TETSI|nr:hypothetical protein HHK36_014933 [Tetracentron sinense]
MSHPRQLPTLSLSLSTYKKKKMEKLESPFYGSLKRYWRRRRYQRLDGTVTSKKTVKMARFRGGNNKRFWRIRVIPKLRLKIVSPLKLLGRLRDAYVNMMLGLAGNVRYFNSGNSFGDKRIPKARQVPMLSPYQDIDSRLVYEIYKSLMASRELATS